MEHRNKNCLASAVLFQVLRTLFSCLILVCSLPVNAAAENVLRGSGVTPADKTRSIQLKEQGNTYLDKKNYPEAIKYYLQAVQVNPGLGAAYYDLGTAYGHLKDKKNSMFYFYKAIRSGYEKEMLYYNMGYFSTSWGDYDEAIRDYEIIRKRNPHNFATIFNLALVYKQVGRLDDAYHLVETGLKIKPNNPGLRRLGANIQLDMRESAHDSFKLSYYLDRCEKHVAIACEKAGYIDMARNKADKALLLFKTACLAGQNLSCAQGGYLAYKSKKLPLAITLYRKGCDLKNPDACTDLGDLAWRKQNWKKAFMLYLTGCGLGGARACGLVGDTASRVSPGLAQRWYQMSCHLGNKTGCQKALENSVNNSSTK